MGPVPKRAAIEHSSNVPIEISAKGQLPRTIIPHICPIFIPSRESAIAVARLEQQWFVGSQWPCLGLRIPEATRPSKRDRSPRKPYHSACKRWNITCAGRRNRSHRDASKRNIECWSGIEFRVPQDGVAATYSREGSRHPGGPVTLVYIVAMGHRLTRRRESRHHGRASPHDTHELPPFPLVSLGSR